MSSPISKVGPPSSGSASRSSSVASNPPAILPEGNGNLDQETSPSPPHYPPILGGSSSSSTPPSLRRTIPSTSTTATVTSGQQAHKLRPSASVGSRATETASLVARRSSDELETGITSLTSGIVGTSATIVSNVRTSKHQPPLLQPKPSGVISGATSSISVSAVSSDSLSASGTTTSLTSIRRRNLPEEVHNSCFQYYQDITLLI